MDVARARATAGRRAGSAGRRGTTAQGRLPGLVGRAATELERLRPRTRVSRDRRASVAERIRHLV